MGLVALHLLLLSLVPHRVEARHPARRLHCRASNSTGDCGAHSVPPASHGVRRLAMPEQGWRDRLCAASATPGTSCVHKPLLPDVQPVEGAAAGLFFLGSRSETRPPSLPPSRHAPRLPLRPICCQKAGRSNKDPSCGSCGGCAFRWDRRRRAFCSEPRAAAALHAAG